MGLCHAVGVAIRWVLASNSFRLLASLADRGRGLDVLTHVGTIFSVAVFPHHNLWNTLGTPIP
jgi:hypothetical protein